jgi:DNA polymerase-3 subunit gamma/tau
MAYEVIARKWRPQQFADVIGQEHVTRTLRNAIRADRLAHAFLFVGSRGTGKTTTARILAKAINCRTGPTETPCDACDACREIMAGTNMDVQEIDGASNNGVDYVRDLRSNALYAPASAPFKIYIIDEVHMLSKGAFNALLKTLEEPPRHVKFMFATTEPQAVPSTILSRCQRFDLRRIPMRLIVQRLRQIADAESLQVDDAALVAIARGADGAMRDAQSALDQLVSFRGERITEPDVLAVFGLVSWRALETLAAAVTSGNVADAIRVVAELDREGKDLRRLTLELLAYFRDLLVCRYVDQAGELTDLADAQVEALRAQARDADPERLLRVVEILTDADGRMRYALAPRTLLETALIKAARAVTVVSIEELLQRVEALRHAAGPAAPATATEPPPPPATPPAPPPTAETGNELQRLAADWDSLVTDAGRSYRLALGFLKMVRPVAVDGDRVVLGYPPDCREDYARIDANRVQKAMTKALGNRLGREVQAEFALQDDLPAAPPPPREDASPGQEPPPPNPRPDGGNSPRTRAEWMAQQAVRKTLETFNGDIVDIRD